MREIKIPNNRKPIWQPCWCCYRCRGSLMLTV